MPVKEGTLADLDALGIPRTTYVVEGTKPRKPKVAPPEKTIALYEFTTLDPAHTGLSGRILVCDTCPLIIPLFAPNNRQIHKLRGWAEKHREILAKHWAGEIDVATLCVAIAPEGE
jgi:hypothetical protein